MPRGKKNTETTKKPKEVNNKINVPNENIVPIKEIELDSKENSSQREDIEIENETNLDTKENDDIKNEVLDNKENDDIKNEVLDNKENDDIKNEVLDTNENDDIKNEVLDNNENKIVEVEESKIAIEIDESKTVEVNDKELEIESKKDNLKNIINELKDEVTLIDNKFIFPDSSVKNILGNEENNLINFLSHNDKSKSNLNNKKKYTFSELQKIFLNFNESIFLIQIIDKKLTFIEKKNSKDINKNQDILDLIYKLNNDFDIPPIQFLVITKNNLSIIEKNMFDSCENIINYEKLNEPLIFDYLVNLSKNCIIENDLLHKSIFYVNSDKFYKNRLHIHENSLNFYYKGSDFQINMTGIDDSLIKINIIENNTTIYYNELEIFKKFTPLLLNENKNQQYKIIIEQNTIKIIVEEKFNLVKASFESENIFSLYNVEIKSNKGGWWII